MFWLILGLALAPLQHAADLNNGFKARSKAAWAIAGMTDLCTPGLWAMSLSRQPWLAEFACTELRIRASVRAAGVPRFSPDTIPLLLPYKP